MGWIVRLNGKGRIVIPGEVREKLGIKKGDNIVLDIRDNEIVLTMLDTKATQNANHNHLVNFLKKNISKIV